MNRMKPGIVPSLAVVLALFLGAGAAWGEQENGGAPGSWLSTYVGARTLGLGGAFVGAADDASSVIWNPAGLSTLVPNELHMDAARLFEDTTIGSFGFAVPGNKLPSFGLTVLTLRSGQFEKTDEMNTPLGTFNESETAYIFTMSRAINPRFAVGVNSKLVRQSLEDFNGGGFGFDVGAIMSVTPSLKIGASALNLGGPNITLQNTKETYATQFRGGFSYTTLRGRGLIAIEADQNQGSGLSLHGGSEYWVQRIQLPPRGPLPVRLRRLRPPARHHPPDRRVVPVRRLLRERPRGARGLLADRRERRHQHHAGLAHQGRHRELGSVVDQQDGRGRAEVRREGHPSGPPHVGRQG